MTVHLLEYFRDENPGVFRSHPLEVIRATTLAHAGNPFVDSNDRAGAERVVFYNDVSDPDHPAEIRLVLRMVTHAGGAWNKAAALGTQGGPTEGRFLHSGGTMAAGLAATSQVQGVLFANYYDLHANRLQDARVVTAQQNGDLYWVVVEGMIECLAGTDTIDVDQTIMTSVAVQGGMADVADPSTEEASPRFCLGIALENGGAANLAMCLVDIRATGYRALP